MVNSGSGTTTTKPYRYVHSTIPSTSPEIKAPVGRPDVLHVTHCFPRSAGRGSAQTRCQPPLESLGAGRWIDKLQHIVGRHQPLQPNCLFITKNSAGQGGVVGREFRAARHPANSGRTTEGRHRASACPVLRRKFAGAGPRGASAGEIWGTGNPRLKLLGHTKAHPTAARGCASAVPHAKTQKVRGQRVFLF